jgi:hypothetical protein
MSHLLESIAGLLVSCFDLPEKATRMFVVLAMGVAGFCFLVLAALSVARTDVVGVIGALLLAALAVPCFWLVWRGRRA